MHRLIVIYLCSANSPTIPARHRLCRAISFGELLGEEIDAVVSTACSRASTPIVATTQSRTNGVDELIDLEAEESDTNQWYVSSVVLYCLDLFCL